MAVLTGRQSGSDVVVDSTLTVPVSAYTLANTILLFTYRGGDDRAQRGFLRGRKATTTTIVFERSSGAVVDPTVEWELLEFDTDVAVEELAVTGSTTQAISAVTLARSFIVPSGIEAANNQWTGDEYCRWRFNSTTQVETLGTNSININNAQVVDFTGCSVQEVVHSLSSTTLTLSDDVIASVTAGDSLLIATYSDDNSDSEQDRHQWRARILNSTTVRFERNTGTSLDADWNYFVCEFTDGTSLQQAVETVGSGATIANIIVTAVTIAETASVISGSGPLWALSGRSALADDDTRTILFSVVLTTTTNLRLQRETSGAESQLAYQLVEWNTAAAAVARGPIPTVIGHAPMRASVY